MASQRQFVTWAIIAFIIYELIVIFVPTPQSKPMRKSEHLRKLMHDRIDMEFYCPDVYEMRVISNRGELLCRLPAMEKQ